MGWETCKSTDSLKNIYDFKWQVQLYNSVFQLARAQKYNWPRNGIREQKQKEY